MVRPCVARGFRRAGVSGLASMYPVSDWSSFAPDQHGYQRACDLINGQASTDHLGHQCSHAPGRPILHLFLSSRRPRRVKGVWGHHVIACPFNALSGQADWAAASLNWLASKERPCARTLQAIRASLLASAIASTLRCSRFLAASIQDLSSWRSQLFGLISTTHAACTNRTRK